MEYKGIEYPVAFVGVDGKVVIVATESLERVLMPDGANYADNEARWVDERIFCYVPDDLFEAFQRIGYIGMEEREDALEIAIDTLQSDLVGRNDLEEYVNKEYL